MAKSKFLAVAAAAALAAMLGLSACGGQAGSSSSTSSKSSTSSSVSSSASSSSKTSSSTSAENTLVSWQGALVDGTLVDYISSDDGNNGGLVLTKQNSGEPKRWLGAMKTTADGTVTITDDTTKDSVSFKLVDISKDGAVAIDMEGYGKGALVPMTAADWERVAEAEVLAQTLGTVVNTVGVLEDGSLIAYIENQEGTEAVVAITPKNSTKTKTWSGKATTAADGKETVTDTKTGETFSYTWTENKEDGTVRINTDDYGKGVLVKMTVADWMALDELAKASKTK